MKKLIAALFIVSFIISCANYGKEKTFNGVQLFYTSSISEAEADSLGNFLIQSEFADGSEKTVQLTKSGNTYEFRMVVKKGIETDNEFAKIFKQFASDLSEYVFNGAQVDLHGCDDNLETLRVYPMNLPQE